MLVRKTNPVGIDDVVDTAQEVFDLFGGSVLGHPLNGISWDSFPRAYMNPKALKAGQNVPEVYTGNGEYGECLMNDKVVLTTFFYSGSNRTVSGDEFIQPLSLIVQCSDLEEIFPSVDHRADEELMHAFVTLLKQVPGIELDEILTTVDEVYSEFDRDSLRLDDMGEFFVFRVNMTASYGLDCCPEC